MNKILSILIPVYNTEKYISKCLHSILLKEIINDIEIIIVNDGSVDGSKHIIEGFKNQYPNTIKIVNKENGGHGSTINTGLKLATGKYFRVLDSDDWFSSDAFIIFIRRLKKVDVDLVLNNMSREYIFNGVSELTTYNINENQIVHFDKFNFKKIGLEYFYMQTSTYKTDLLKASKLKLSERCFYVDMQFNTQPILLVNNFIYFNLDIYRYFIGRPEQSVNMKSLVKYKKNHEDVLISLIEDYSKKYEKYSTTKREYIEKIIILMCRTHYNIFCKFDNDKMKSKEHITNFDKFLKGSNLKIYKQVFIKDYEFIHLNRLFGFWFMFLPIFFQQLFILFYRKFKYH